MYISPPTTVTPPTDLPTEESCLNFDRGWNGFTGSKYGYFEAINVKRVTETPARGKSGYFDGTARIEYPAVANSYGSTGKFSVSLWYKRTGPSTVRRGRGMACGTWHVAYIVSRMTCDALICDALIYCKWHLIRNKTRIASPRRTILSLLNQTHNCLFPTNHKRAIKYHLNIVFR